VDFAAAGNAANNGNKAETEIVHTLIAMQVCFYVCICVSLSLSSSLSLYVCVWRVAACGALKGYFQRKLRAAA